jgi:hypothetical protein
LILGLAGVVESLEDWGQGSGEEEPQGKSGVEKCMKEYAAQDDDLTKLAMRYEPSQVWKARKGMLSSGGLRHTGQLVNFVDEVSRGKNGTARGGAVIGAASRRVCGCCVPWLEQVKEKMSGVLRSE